MNSEASPNPESDNNDFVRSTHEPEELIIETESNSEELPDVWLDESTPTADNEEISLEVESTVEQGNRDNSELESPEIDSNDWSEGDEYRGDLRLQSDEESDLTTETELFTDRWLDEPQAATESSETIVGEAAIDKDLTNLKQQKEALNQEISALVAQKEALVLQQAREVQETLGKFVEEGMKELKERKNNLQIEIEKLERRRERIRQEMRTTFAGSSQELAVRVQGFKDYLVGSLQDLAVAAEKLELSPVETKKPSRERIREPRERGRDRDREPRRERGIKSRTPSTEGQFAQPQFSEPAFAAQTRKIKQLLDRYRTSPDYYGRPWQLRRTFEPIHAEKVQEWFFSQGGRGAIDSMSSRLQNILVASATISVLHSLYGDRCRVLVLIDTPEKLGEWRKGLQDCLGISRSDFGSNRGVVLFDSAEVVVQRAERLVKDKLLPFIVIDETDELINISLLKFPLWLAFASGNKSSSSNYLY